MNKWQTVKRIKRASIASVKMNAARWTRDRERRESLAAAAPAPSYEIVKRIVVIWGERVTREVTIYAHETARDARRKERWALKPTTK